MTYFLRKEAIILLLYIILIIILRSGVEKKKITYWQIVESFIIVVGLEAMTEYYGAYMQSNTYVLIYAIAQWLLLNIVYILAGLTIYHACTQSEMSYIAICKHFPLWVRVCIPVFVVLGVILTVLENYYYIGMLEQLNQGNINLMEMLTTNFVNPYQRIKEGLRILNIGILVYGCRAVHKSYDK